MTQVEAIRELGIDVDVQVLPPDGAAGSRYLRGLRNLRNAVKAGGVDLIHAHYSYMGMIARLQRRVPTIVTYHGSDLYGMVANADGRYALRGKVAVSAGCLLANFVDAAIVQSEAMAAKLRPQGRVHIVPHEVDTSLFRPVDRAVARKTLGLDPAKRLILFAADPGRLVKRFSLAEAAREQLLRDGCDADLMVVHREPQERLSLYMSACDALILTSFHEGSPNVVKQAMACNLAVVSTNVGDVGQLIGNTDGCSICAPRAADFATALRPLLDEPRRTNGRQAVEHLTKRHVAERIVRIYETVLQAHSGRPQRTETSATLQ